MSQTSGTTPASASLRLHAPCCRLIDASTHVVRLLRSVRLHRLNCCVYVLRRECQRLHPGYEFKLWTDASAREMIAEDYPEYLAMYDGYKYGIQVRDCTIQLCCDCLCPFPFPFPLKGCWASRARPDNFFKTPFTPPYAMIQNLSLGMWMPVPAARRRDAPVLPTQVRRHLHRPGHRVPALARLPAPLWLGHAAGQSR